MKKSVLFSLVLLVGFGLSAMEVEEDSATFPFDQLPQELQCEIARLALPDQMKIAPKDAVQDVAEYAHDKGLVLSVAPFRGGTRVVSGGNGQAKIADVDNDKIKTYAGSVFSIGVFPDDKRLLFGGHDKKVKIVHVDSGKIETVYAHDRDVSSVAVFPSGKRMVSGGYDKKVKIADADGKVQVEYVYNGSVNSVAVFPSGRRMVVVVSTDYLDYTVMIVNADSGEVQAEYACDGRVSEVAVFPSGKLVIFGVDRKVKIVNADSGKIQAEYTHDGSVSSAKPFPDGTRVISGGREDKKVKIVNVVSGETEAEYEHDGEVTSVAVFSDGTRVLSGGYDKKVKIKSLVPLLLAKFQLPEETTFDRYSLLKRLQENLLIKKKPLIIGQSDRDTLAEMPELKELLRIETNKNTKDKKAALWRLQMKYAPDVATSGGGKDEEEEPDADECEQEVSEGWLSNCVVM